MVVFLKMQFLAPLQCFLQSLVLANIYSPLLFWGLFFFFFVLFLLLIFLLLFFPITFFPSPFFPCIKNSVSTLTLWSSTFEGVTKAKLVIFPGTRMSAFD